MDGTHFSWTTDKQRGQWFASRFSGDGKRPFLITGECDISDVLLFIDKRNESEVVIPDSSLMNNIVVNAI